MKFDRVPIWDHNMVLLKMLFFDTFKNEVYIRLWQENNLHDNKTFVTNIFCQNVTEESYSVYLYNYLPT